MNNLHASALTYAALVSLKEALNRAENPSDFLAEADTIIHDPANILPLKFDSGDPDRLVLDSAGGSGRDVENAPKVYEFLGALDRSNAADKRLWTYLAFATYRTYMEQRWPLTEVGNWKSRVTDRWLMPNATRGKLVRHGIARLWWVASLTYDPKREHALSKSDPFAYTREAFKNEERIISIFDRQIGANTSIVRGVLEHIAQGAGYATDDHLRILMKELTLVYGYRDIGVLDALTARALIAESAPAVKNNKALPVAL